MPFFGRGKNKIQNPVTLKEMYLDYIKDKEGEYKVTLREYIDIASDYYQSIVEYILYRAGEVKLPYGLGSMSIKKKKSS